MSVTPPRATPVLDASQVWALQDAATRVFVHHAVAQYAVDLVMATRDPASFELPWLAELVESGASPRATLGLVAAARALALMRGRDYVLPADITAVAHDVLAHRLALTFDALTDGVDPRVIVGSLLGAVPRPRVAPQERDDEPSEPAA